MPENETTQAAPQLPTYAELMRVVMFVNAMVANHLRDAHGMTAEEIVNATPDVVAKLHKECALSASWSHLIPVFEQLGQQMQVAEMVEQLKREEPLPGDSNPTKSFTPRILGKMGQA